MLMSAQAVVVGWISVGNDKIKGVHHELGDGLKEQIRFVHTSDENLVGKNKDKIGLHKPQRVHTEFKRESVALDALDAAGDLK